MILGSSFVLSHTAVLDYAKFTASFRRDGRLFTVTPSSVLSDGVASASTDPNVKFRQSDSSSSLPKAKFKDKSDQHTAFSAILGDANPQHFLSCAQARKSIQRGCCSFLVLVDEADTASVTEPDVTTAPVESSASDEAADLQLQVDDLKQDFAEVFAEPFGLPPDRGVEHVIPLLPDSQPPFQRMYRLAPSELQEVQRQITDLLSKQLIEPSTSPYGAPFLWRRRVVSSGWW